MSAMTQEALAGGFADAPHEAASAFRALLDVMSRPGRIETLAGAAPPAPLPLAAGVLALTLCDAETPVWLSPALRGKEVEGWLRFHASAPLTQAPGEAAFAFGPTAELAAIEDFAIGTPEHPDRSATLVCLVDAFDGDALRLRGPGIKGEARLPLGADAAPAAALCAVNAALFPQGRDLFLVAGARVAALPRSTRIAED